MPRTGLPQAVKGQHETGLSGGTVQARSNAVAESQKIRVGWP